MDYHHIGCDLRDGVRDLAQLDDAFRRVATRESDIEKLHSAGCAAARNLKFALYRDFPDRFRGTGNAGVAPETAE
jgi:hypothetical protein